MDAHDPLNGPGAKDHAAADGPDDGPRMLPTVSPSSELGKSLHDAVARLRFANVAPEVRDMAQKILEGKAGPRDLLDLEEFRPTLAEMQRRLRADVEAMSDEERRDFLNPGAGPGSRA
jgi:hypothetical protein